MSLTSATIFRAVGSLLRSRNFSNPRFESLSFKKHLNFRQLSVEVLPKDDRDCNKTVEPTNLEIPSLLEKSTGNSKDLNSQSALEPFNPTISSGSFGLGNFTSFKELSEENFDFEKDIKFPRALDRCEEDVSDLAPPLLPTYNFAAYANESPIIQEFIKLGVKLYKVERVDGAMELILRKNVSDLKSHIQLLVDCGVEPLSLGDFITKNPMIFNESIDDIKTRIRYLRAHKFDVQMISRIVTKNPFWLNFRTDEIDKRLGMFQKQFKMNGYCVRFLATKQPNIITYKIKSLRENFFAIQEELGFTREESKELLLRKPRVFMKSRRIVTALFDYVHNTMKVPHSIILLQPNILTTKLQRLEQRHKFLVNLGRAQYNPKEPLYVSLDALISGTDEQFCQDVAKTSLVTYEMYLKTI